MALGKSDNDDKAAWCIRQTIDFWGREPTQQELNFTVAVLDNTGAQSVINDLYNNPNGVAFRAKRGW